MGLHLHVLNIQIASRIKGIPRERDFRKWLVATLPMAAELTLRVVNAAEGRALNNGFRGKSYATNVLTFVYHDKKPKLLMGDIVLCAPVVAREASEQGKTLAAHYAHLTIHGVLHLAGMNHEVERAAKAMEKTEIALLESLGFDSPYTDS